ncbi:uncharacterized protein LOC127869134 [Dreissena polymorpha]|uniref:uncharacterized protein LOC127869134 n=1 Tax=Dreissena polymorpha TaxID=45954 RepID=UPI002263F967|nr:uncharacterized protein LOC127869134 [Dreissena polymorpha]
MYCTLYSSVVRDARTNISLQDFIDDDGPEWAERIIERMTEPSWTMGWVQKIVRGHVTEEEYNMAMNTLFVKLHMLDPQSVIPTFHLLNHIRALPECNLELATRDYLGGPLDAAELSAHARTAVTTETMPSNGASRMSLDKIDVFYGIDVEEFIMTEGTGDVQTIKELVTSWIDAASCNLVITFGGFRLSSKKCACIQMSHPEKARIPYGLSINCSSVTTK